MYRNLIGIGVDLVSINRIEKVIERWGELKFLNKILTASEIEVARATTRPKIDFYRHVAGRLFHNVHYSLMLL